MSGMTSRTEPTATESDLPAAPAGPAESPSARRDEKSGDRRGPIWGRPETRRRSTLSRATIVQAAIDLADSEGLTAVSIRRVAAELGARAMSLYTYLDTKDELFQLMADEASGEVLLPEPLPTDWREGLTLIARYSRTAFTRHPWIVELSAERRPGGGPNGLRHVEQSLRAVAGLDVPLRQRWLILMAVDDYTLGYVTREVLEAHDGWDQQRAMILDQPYYRQLLSSGEFPLLSEALGTDLTEADTFEIGLRWLLDGIEANLHA